MRLLFAFVYRCTVGIDYAVGAVEGFQIYFPKADTCFYGDDSAQEFAMTARIERGQRKFVPAFLLAQVAHLPDKIVGGLTTEPRFQHVADAEPFVLCSKEPPCALQP